jgi:Xaa-Pro aminopeptidase
MSVKPSGHVHRAPRNRWHRIPEILRPDEIDVLVAVSPENVVYTSGHWEYTLPFLRDRISATIIPASGDPTYLVVNKIEGAARRNSWISTIVTYRENADSPIRAIADVLAEQGFANGNVAVEKEFLSACYFDELRTYLPKATLRDASGLLARVRSVKTDEEVAFISEAVRSTETAHLTVYETLRPGDTEIAIARRLRAQLLIEGADYVEQNSVETGRNGLEGHHIPDQTPIKPGDVAKIDSGGKYNGYSSDMSRPIVVGRPSSRHRSMWRKLRDVQREAVERVRVGVRAGQAYAALRTKPGNEGITFYGHGIGVFEHDAPMLTEFYSNGLRTTTNLSADWELEPNMLVFVELSLKDHEGGNCYHFEDLVLVTDSGPRILSNVMDTEEMFVVE